MKRNNKKIEFTCIEKDCGQAIVFKLSDIEKNLKVVCPHCSKVYKFNKDFVEKLKKFDMLVCAVRDAREILSDTNIAINFKNDQVCIPYRLLLTRMNTLLTLKIGEHKVVFRFRVEPLLEDAEVTC